MLIIALIVLATSASALNPADAHVFLHGESITIRVPKEITPPARTCRVLNEEMDRIAEHLVSGPILDLGRLAPGWYRIEFRNGENALSGYTTAAVLTPLTARPPDNSPIAVDVALAWLGASDQQDWPLYAQLAQVAGVRWVRDRIHWREMQSKDGSFFKDTKYDSSATIQSAQGLQLLQVFHTRPPWALAPDGNADHPRTDLAKLYQFCRGMAQRFQGKVQAWEPWNEGNAGNFGGFSLDELCAIQKAAYLGFKAGDPDLTVCWNPLGGVNIESQTRSILRNETWPYYDVYSIHSYDWPESYEDLWVHARDAASGKPIWVTESDRGMTAAPDSDVGDFTPKNDQRKAELVAQSYVRSLYAGASRHFHFILGPYMEGEQRTQFGLLRKDLTPRPSFVAVANLGRILAGATCLGRYLVPDQPDIHIYAFRAQPDGSARDVLVAWTESPGDWASRGNARAPWPVEAPLPVEAAFNYLGRPLASAPPVTLRPDPVFLVLPEGAAQELALRTVAPAKVRSGSPSSVVLQFDAANVAPIQRRIGWSPEAAYEFSPGTRVDASLTVYNLGAARVTGHVTLKDLPGGWHVTATSWAMDLEPGEQRTVPLHFELTDQAETGDVWLDFRGDFGTLEQPVLSVWSRKPPEP